MPAISAKTLAEMQAGAEALAVKSGLDALPAGYMAAMERTHERHRLMRKWEDNGLLTVENTKRYTSDKNDENFWHHLYHVKGGDTFTDIPAEKSGASPSEVLVAAIALNLQALGKL